MANIGGLLRDEISRLARKEVRALTGSLKKTSVQYRRVIAALKRDIADLQRKLRSLQRVPANKAGSEPRDEGSSRKRFAAKGLRAQRERLGISAADYAGLLGVSAQSVYNWERGITKPRAEQIAMIASLRGIGKREAQARLEKLQPRAKKRRTTR
jgi:DNA-binding transcriptional regulator YiaG